MRVLGIDLAAQPASTGIVLVSPIADSRWRATVVEGPADDDRIVEASRQVDSIGVDSPVGWPVEFVDAVSAHARFERWPGTTDRSRLTHRDTDRRVRELCGRWPLSASADKLGSVAMRCALLQSRLAEEVWGTAAPRDGSGPLVETYPAGALAAWQIDARGYKDKRNPTDAIGVRNRVIDRIATDTSSWLDLEPVRAAAAASDHVLDALLCALVAMAAKSGATHPPTPAEREAALIEGWVHVPSRPLADSVPRASIRQGRFEARVAPDRAG